MMIKIFSAICFLLAESAFAYSTLDCTSNQNISYLSHSKVGGAAPYPGMITHIEEIKKNSDVIYRIVHRAGCDRDEFCHTQQPELVDIVPSGLRFHFIDDSKIILSSEGQDPAPVKKETYAIKFVLDEEIWMICDSFIAFYP